MVENLLERVEVLDAIRHNLESRLLATKTPVSVLEHADRLEERGRELIAQAELVRKNLVRDTELRDDLERELALAKIEQELCRSFLRQGVKPNRSVRSIVLSFLKGVTG